ncbi:pentapeptide repeat-containing protein [Acinetobacter baumannii]|uniref:pentapeptide repeat-containing protein n=1 Tax=Acinetobacter baumannii TaxID=470 RepID=UPI0012988513|nr:pentapeptide repeat-containing protein [Acinetobacter baumannii]MQZ79273.1 pentapeptide repeat-containing protein [Acinetobacter baumannii]
MTQKFEIKNRWTKEVLFTCDIPEGMESGMIARHAVEAAIAADADLRGADLYGADLRGAKAAPLFVYGLCWDVIISGLGKMRIGCQEHSVADWKSFDDARITRMDSEALEFWNQHKLMLLNMCDSYVHPVEETSNDSE